MKVVRFCVWAAVLVPASCPASVFTSAAGSARLTFLEVREEPVGEPVGRTGLLVLNQATSGGFGHAEPPENGRGGHYISLGGFGDYDGFAPIPGSGWQVGNGGDGRLAPYGYFSYSVAGDLRVSLINVTNGASRYHVRCQLEYGLDVVARRDQPETDEALADAAIWAYTRVGFSNSHVASNGLTVTGDGTALLTGEPIVFDMTIGAPEDGPDAAFAEINIRFFHTMYGRTVPGPSVACALALPGLTLCRRRRPRA